MRNRVRNAAAILLSAATLLAAGVVGIGSANAAETDVPVNADNGKIIVNNVPAGHTLEAVRIGTYTHASSNATNTLSGVSVGTPSALKDQIKAAAKVANDGVAPTTDGAADNPMSWVAKNLFASESPAPHAGTIRTFVTALVKGDSSTAALDFSDAVSPAVTAKAATFSDLPVGIYVIRDTMTSSAAHETASIPMLVGTTIDTYAKLGSTDLGKVDMKDQTPTLTKVASKFNGTSLTGSDRQENLDKAKIGDQIEFTLTTEVPNTTGFDSYNFKITDTPSAGLAYDASSINVAVGRADKTSEQTITASTTTTPMTIVFPYKTLKDYTVGAPITITYTATLAKVTDATWQKQSNKASLEYSNDSSSSTSTGTVNAEETDLAMYSVTLKNVKASDDSTGLTGGKFSVYKTDESGKKTGDALKFGGSDGFYTYNTGTKDELATKGTAEALNDGELKVDGLPAGTYAFDQTAAASGYIKTSFNVTIKKNVEGTAEVEANAHTDNAYFTNTEGTLGLVAKNSITQNTGDRWNGILTVKNANSITQLPLTGGVGIVLLAALIVISGCIAGGTAVLRRRSANRG